MIGLWVCMCLKKLFIKPWPLDEGPRINYAHSNFTCVSRKKKSIILCVCVCPCVCVCMFKQVYINNECMHIPHSEKRIQRWMHQYQRFLDYWSFSYYYYSWLWLNIWLQFRQFSWTCMIVKEIIFINNNYNGGLANSGSVPIGHSTYLWP